MSKSLTGLQLFSHVVAVFQERRREEERKRREEKEARRLAAEAKAKEVDAVLQLLLVVCLLSILFCRKSGDYALKLAKLSASKRRLIAGSWSRNDQNFVRGGLWREKDYCAGLMLSVIFCKRLTVNLLSSDRLHHT